MSTKEKTEGFIEWFKSHKIRNVNWTKPYYGCSYLGEMKDCRRSSIADYNSFINISFHTKDGGFSPPTVQVIDMNEAKAMGEYWIKMGTYPVLFDTIQIGEIV